MSSANAVATVWRHRSLLLALVLRDFKNRYAGSMAGALWALLNPLAMLAIYAVVFEYVFRVRVPNLASNQPFVLFVALALWPWLAFQEAVMRGTLAVQNNASLVKKVAFPHELLVYSAVAASFAVHVCGFVVVLTVLRLLGFALHLWAWPVVLATLLALVLLATALALLLGALQVFVRDVEQVLSQVLSVLFYATPILYPMSLVPPWLASIMQFNPLVHVLETIRNALLGASGTDWSQLGIMLLASVGVFYLARRFFLKLSPHFEDMV
jgi:lipopolysaccharide transport system permease protein